MSNLNFLFDQLKSFSPNQTKLLGGQLSLFRRPNSHKWQCRFKLPSGQWHVASTGCEVKDEAKQQAISIHAAIQARLQEGWVVTSRTFGQLAFEELENMRQKAASGEGRRTYADYAFALKKYLIPFFGKAEIAQINEEQIKDFEAWRISQMGLVPKASTKRNHASAYMHLKKSVIHMASSLGFGMVT